MSNVERFSIEDESVNLLLNKFQRHRGDTLNSRMYPISLFQKSNLIEIYSNCLRPNYLSVGGNRRCEACALVRYEQVL
jgi:hypothetical protein